MPLQVQSSCDSDARTQYLVLNRCPHSVSHSGFMWQTEIMDEPVQFVPKTRSVLHGSCDDIIYWLGVWKLCNPSLLCHFNCGLVYVASLCYSLPSHLGLKPSYSWPSWGWELHYHVWSSSDICPIGKVEFKEAGAGSCWDGRLGYKVETLFSKATLKVFFLLS